MLNRFRSADFFFTLFFALSLFSYYRGFNGGLQIWGEPYIWINYSDGLVKRGLVGTFFEYFFGSDSPDRRRIAALVLHWFCSVFLLFFVLLWGRRRIEDGGDGRYGVFYVTFALFVGGQFLPTLAYNTAYLDIYIYLLFALAVFSFSVGWFVLAFTLGLFAPLVHESALFYWLTIFVLVAFSRGLNISIIYAVLPVSISTVILLLFHSQSAAEGVVASMPIPLDVKEGMLSAQFGQSILSSFSVMLGVWRESFVSGILGLLGFGLFAFLMVFFYCRCFLSTREALVLFASVLAPASILLFAWDLSRFVVSLQFVSVVSLLYVDSVFSPALRRGVSEVLVLVLIVVALVGLSMPLVYAYFNGASVVDNGILPLGRIGVGWLSHEFASYFNRG
ncbi:hypothetical protein [Stutzerimonas stutzeri]|uniref:EpsG family protein n=1 Tax=Stutzerimonas stutzeri TaxID=316 RepID=A0AA40RSS8_STUST|nr:hypothetical protein [Stutzerimonas stutzeri]MBA1305302.1 hypothetical protein [Stutzerimonas stutzeri]